MSASSEIRLVRYNPHNDAEGLTDALIQCYREVFGEDPWNEWKKCQVCGRKWGKQELTSDDDHHHCGMLLVDFWPEEIVRADLLHEITAEASCRLALDGNKVIGFCWGYPISPIELEQKLGITELAEALTREFGALERVAYQDELGVLSMYRGKKLARQLFTHRLKDFLEKGLSVGVIRTKTNPPSVTYLWFTGKLGYKLIAEYKDEDGRVVLAKSFAELFMD